MPIKVAYLFGAGASQGELSYSGALKSILTQSITDAIALKLGGEQDSIYDDVRNELGEHVDIEHLITLYEASGTRIHNEIAKKLKTSFREEIQASIRELGDSFVPMLFSALIDMHSIEALGEKLEIILTTNYEDLIEKAMESVKGGVNYLIKAIPTENYFHITGDPVPPILKLHGSFNWKNDYPIIIESEIKEEEDIIWIPPGVVKRRQYYPFDIIWGKARELLECDVLRIIGCSLSQNDWELISLLFTTQKQGTSQEPSYRIELIDYPDKCEEIEKQYRYFRNLTTILEMSEVREFLVKTYLPTYIGQEEVPEEMVRGVAKYLSEDKNKNNIFALWLRAKGEKLYDDGVSIKSEKGYFEKLILSGLGL